MTSFAINLYANNDQVNEGNPSELCRCNLLAEAVSGFTSNAAGVTGLGSTAMFALCALTEGIGCGLAVALDFTTLAFSAANTVSSCGIGGAIARKSLSLGLSALSTGAGSAAVNCAGSVNGGLRESFASDGYGARQACAIGGASSGTSSAGNVASYAAGGEC